MLDTSKTAQNMVSNANGATVSLDNLGKVSKASEVAMKGLTIAGNAFAGIAIGLVLSLAVKLFDDWIHRAENAKKSAEDLASSFKEVQNTQNSNTSTISAINDEYRVLSDGVNKLGENVSLTTKEYSRYHDICNQIADIMPNLVQGYDDQGNAILTLKGKLVDLNKEYDKYKQNEAIKIYSDDTDMSSIFENYKNAVEEPFYPNPLISNILTTLTLSALNIKTSKVDEIDNLTELSKLSDLDIIDILSSSKSSLFATILKQYGLDRNSTHEEIEAARTNIKIDLQGLQTEIDTSMSQISSAAITYGKMSDSYWGLDSETQAYFQTLLNGITPEFVEANNMDSEVGMQNFVNNLIISLKENKDGVNDAFNELFNLDISALSPIEVQNKVNALLNQIATALNLSDDGKLQLKIVLGIEDTDTLVTKYNKAINKFQGKDNNVNLEDYFKKNGINSRGEIDYWSDVTVGAKDAANAVEMYEKAKISETPNSFSFTVVQSKVNEASNSFSFTEEQSKVNEASNSFSFTEEQSKAIDDFQSKVAAAKDAIQSLKDGTMTQPAAIDLIKGLGIDPYKVDLSTESYEGLEEQLRKIVNISFDDVIDSLEEMKNTDEDSYDAWVKTFTNLKNGINGAVKDVKLPTDYISNLQEIYDLQKNINDELKDGDIQNSTLEKIGEKYPELQNTIGLLQSGVEGSEQELINALQGYYDTELDNYKEYLISKNLENESFYKSVGLTDSNIIDNFNANYGVDLSNVKTYAQAKFKIEQNLLAQLGEMWSRYYDAQTGTFSEEFVSYSAAIERLPKDSPEYKKHKKDQEEIRKKIENAANAREALKKILDIPFKPDGGKENGTSTKETIATIDWAAHSIDILSKKISNLDKKLQNTDGWDAQHKILTKIIKAQKGVVSGYEKQVKAYKSVYTKAKEGLKSSDIEAIENGTKFNIKDYKSNPEYYNKLTDAIAAYKNLTEAKSNLAQENYTLEQRIEDRIQKKVDKYNALVKQWESELDNAGTAKEKNTIINSILSAQRKEINNEKKLAKTDEERIALEQKWKGIVSSYSKQKFDNLQTEYENKSAYIANTQNQIQSEISLTEARGALVGRAYYDGLISLEKKNQKVLISERKDLQKKLDDAVKSGKIKKYDDDWYDMRQSIMGVESAITDSKTAVENFKNSIRQLRWDNFDKLIAKFQQVSDEANFLINLMSNSKLHNDDGSYTDKGLATLAMHGTNYDIYYKQAQEYANQISNINKQLANDPNNQTYLDKRNELISAQQQAILNAESEKQSMISLAQEGIKAEIDAYSDLINKKKESLQTAKELDEYNASIAEKTKSVAQIQKQLNALEGDNSQEAQKTIRELKAKLSNAQKDLSDTQANKAYDNAVEALDAQLETYTKSMEEYSEDTDTLFTQTMALVNASSSTVSSTIASTAASVGYSISSTIAGAWSSSGTVLSEYNTTFKNTSTTMLTSLSLIKSAWDDVAKSAEEAAQAQLDAINKNEAKGSAAVDMSKNTKQQNNIISLLQSANGKGEISNDTSALNQWVSSNFGTRLSKANMLSLASMLGLSDITSTSIVDNDKQKEQLRKALIKALDGAAFSSGGIISDINNVVTTNGDTGIATFRPKETVLTEKFTNILPFATEILDEFVNMQNLARFNTLPSLEKNLINHAPPSLQSTFTIENLSLPNVIDTASFVNELQTNSKIQNMIQEMTIGQINGNGSLSKYKY